MRRSLQQRLSHGLAAAALGCASGCGALPPRTPEVKPLPPRQAEAHITLQDRRGPVSAPVQAGDLARLRAEGHAERVQRHLGVLAAAGEAELYRGNSARLLVDGPETFAAMKAAIGAARRRVLLESYIIEDGGIAQGFADLLLKKAAEGVHVAVLYDSIGSLESDRAFFDRLRAGGIAVCAYNPVNPLERPGHWSVIQRNHRKMLAVDSDVAYTGGINLSDVYASGSGPGGSGLGGSGGSGSGGAKAPSGEEGWRDTQVELRGPVVNAMAVVFRESWASQGCPGALPPAPPPRQPTAGTRVVKLVAGDPRAGVNPTYQALMKAVDAATKSVHLTMAYFAPGKDLVQALSDAAARGVDVQLVLPGRSDVKLVLAAARSHYAQLLEAGVRIHEFQGSVMHAKTAVIDGVFSSVGSSNLDWRSILVNHEIDVIVLGDDFGQEMEALFQRDVQASTSIEAATWPRRGFVQRVMEGFARLIEPLL